MEPARKQGALAEGFEPSRIGPDDLVTELSIDVEFEGRSPEIKDFHRVKKLLQQLFLKAPVNLTDMTLLLLHPPKIGSVIIKAADYKFEFCVQNDKGSGLAGGWVKSVPEMIYFRRVLIFSMEKFCSITNQLESML